MVTLDSIRMKIYNGAAVHVVGGGASGRAVLKLLERINAPLVFHEKNRHNDKSITILVRCNRADKRG